MTTKTRARLDRALKSLAEHDCIDGADERWVTESLRVALDALEYAATVDTSAAAKFAIASDTLARLEASATESGT